jgi:hypothetical protein
MVGMKVSDKRQSAHRGRIFNNELSIRQVAILAIVIIKSIRQDIKSRAHHFLTKARVFEVALPPGLILKYQT